MSKVRSRHQAESLEALQTVVPSDLETPVSAFIKLRRAFPERGAFLLESVDRGEQVGRFSMVGFHARELVRWEVGDGKNPLVLLKAGLEETAKAVDSPLPFPTGSYGYLSYDAVSAFEKIPRPRTKTAFPDACFVVPERLVLFDHVRNTMTFLVIAEKGRTSDALAEIEEALSRTQPFSSRAGGANLDTFQASETPDSFVDKVKRAQEYIRAGEIYQVVFSQKLCGKTHARSIDVYRALRILNPSPYMFYLDFGAFQLIGSSPEMLVRVRDGVAETKPIAGTRPRGKTREEDRALGTQLLEDPKERAEHVMLVDLGRNDLGRVCRYGTVRVTRQMEIERYSHVMHLVSTVEGNVAPPHTPLDVLQAAFPAGTVTGAPKIRAMEIIHELEPLPRGPYAGCVGYVSFDGSLDSCITIRTIVMEGENVHLQAGAGVVADSNPNREYEETLSKLEALRQAIHLAENRFRADSIRWAPGGID